MLTLFPSQPDMEALHSVSVIGVGGAGTHILNELLPIAPGKTDLISINTDSRLSSFSQANTNLRIGSEVTHGLNCGGDPDLGREAAETALPTLSPHLSGKDMIFLTGGLGGGTGSGVIPVLARKIRESGAFLISFVTIPFSFEGSRKNAQAKNALNELSLYSNMVLIFENDRMSTLVSDEQGVQEAFTAANRLVAESMAFIARMCLKPGLISMGLPDIADVLGSEIGRCLFGYGSASGYDRAGTALEKALNCPLLSNKELLQNAEEVLVHLTGGKDLSLEELERVVTRLKERLSPNAYIHLGATIEDTLSGLSLIIMAGDKSQLPPSPQSSAAITNKPESVPPVFPVPAYIPTPAAPMHSPAVPTAPVSPIQEEENNSPSPIIHGEREHNSQPLPSGNSSPVPLPPPMRQENTHDSHTEDHPVKSTPPSAKEEKKEFPVTQKLNEEFSSEQPPSPPSEKRSASEIQSELRFSRPITGKLAGEEPNFIDDIDLDLPPSLRKNKGI